jgi:hypothetical protein
MSEENKSGPMLATRSVFGTAGFSLVEVLISTVILTTALVTLAQLFAIALAMTWSAKAMTMATLLAEGKVEQLRGLVWAYDEAGARISDTTSDLSTDPPTSTGSGLMSSGGSLAANEPGFVDYLDHAGRWVGTGRSPPAVAVYIRRWSIEPIPDAADDALLLQVLVTSLRDRSDADLRPGVARLRGDARLVTVKVRRAR